MNDSEIVSHNLNKYSKSVLHQGKTYVYNVMNLLYNMHCANFLNKSTIHTLSIREILSVMYYYFDCCLHAHFATFVFIFVVLLLLHALDQQNCILYYVCHLPLLD